MHSDLFERQVAGIVAAVVVQPPAGFWMFGRWVAPPAADEGDVASHSRLVALLQQRLYSACYLTGTTEPRRVPRRSATPGGSSAFVAALDAANRGSGTWQPGWTLADAGSVTATVMRDELTLTLQPGEWRVAALGSVAPGAAVEVRLPNALPRRFPGFYTALSDAPCMPDDSQTVVRLYWNVTARGAAELVEAVTTTLNRARVPFQLKVLHDPAAFTRCDAAVLYLARDDLPAAAPLLERVHAAIAPHLKARIPLLTRPVAPGVGLAEDPPGGFESFGQQRCRLLAEGLVRGWQQATLEQRGATMAATFADAGITLNRPYLNPNTVSDYDIVWTLPITPGYRQRAAHANERDLFLDTAVGIGRRLVADALCHDGRCTWLGVKQAGSWATLGPDVYDGVSGVALFLAELYGVTGEPAFHEAALGGLRQALARADDIAPSQRLGLYTGLPGIAWAAARAAGLLGEPALLDAARDLLSRTAAALPQARELDLLSGRAGAIVALLDWPGDMAALAVRLGEELLAAAEIDSTGWRWRSSTRALPLTGLSHGASGIGHALAELFAATGGGRFRDAALGACDWERSWLDHATGNWPDFRDIDLAMLPARHITLPSSTFWCHGAPGIALACLRAWQVLGDERLRDDALLALETTRRWVVDALDNDANYSLCHGLAGNAEILALGAATLDAAAQLRETALAVAHAGIERHARRDHHWPCGADGGQTPGLLLGLAGIGLFYLRLVQPAIPSVLLPLPRPSLITGLSRG